MAQIRTVRLVDDLTGSEAEETVAFGIEGKAFEIDLSGENATALRDRLAPFVAAARAVGGRPSGRSRRASGAARSVARGHSHAIRTWARENGYKVSERGRIPSAVLTAFEARSTTPAAEPSAAGTDPAKSNAAKSNAAKSTANGSTPAPKPRTPSSVQFSG